MTTLIILYAIAYTLIAFTLITCVYIHKLKYDSEYRSTYEGYFLASVFWPIGIPVVVVLYFIRVLDTLAINAADYIVGKLK